MEIFPLRWVPKNEQPPWKAAPQCDDWEPYCSANQQQFFGHIFKRETEIVAWARSTTSTPEQDRGQDSFWTKQSFNPTELAEAKRWVETLVRLL